MKLAARSPRSSACSPRSCWPEIRALRAPSGASATRPRAFRALLDRSRRSRRRRANIVGVGAARRSRRRAQLPGDPRPWVLAGSSGLVTGQPERALEFYREAFATGERAEIDLNLGRAYAHAAARPTAPPAALLRAGWISPEILEPLCRRSAASRCWPRSRAWREELRQGRLAAPPPLPPEERR